MKVVRLYGIGCSLEEGRFSSSLGNGGGSATGEKRGEIRGFSFASRLRLRQALLSCSLDGGTRVGVTLTLPWVVRDWSCVMDDFRQVMHRFRVYFFRRFPSSGAIFRVELQRRGAPHVHMVSFHRLPLPDDLSSRYFALWLDSLRGDLRGGSLSAFARRGVVVDTDLNFIGVVRYLCDHASKRKQAQLGYKGKQWGILGKANLRFSSGFPFEISDREFVLLSRFLRRLGRFRVRVPCVFGSKLVGGRRATKICYCSDETVMRFLRFLQK